MNSIHRAYFDETVEMDELLERLDNDRELMRELFELLKSELPGLQFDLRMAVLSGERKAIRIAAHSLKGTLVNLAIVKMAKIAGAIEECAVSGSNDPSIAVMSAELDVELEKLIPAIDAYLST